MSTTIKLDAEVRGLLEEIAQDPRSRLFGRTPRQEVTALVQPPAELRAATPAEQELLRANRELVAHNLRYLVKAVSCDMPQAQRRHVNLQALPDIDWSGKLRKLAQAEHHVEPGPALALLLGGSPRVQSLAPLTADLLALVPSEANRNLHGWALLADGQYEAARQVLSTLLGDSASSEVRYWAAINLAFVQYSLDDLPGEVESLVTACAQGPTTQSAAPLMVEAARLGDHRLARLAGSMLEELSEPQDRFLLRYAEILRVEPQYDFLSSLSSKCGPAAQRVIDAALQ